MKIDFSQPIEILGVPVVFDTPTEEELKANPDKKSIPATLSLVVRRALSTPHPEDRLGLDEQVKRGSLALRVASGGVHDITPEDLSLMRRCLRIYSSHELIAVVHGMLDPKDEAKQKK